MIFDILFLIFIGIGFWWGFQKGIIYSLFSLLAYFLGIIAALKFSYLAVKFLHGTMNVGPEVLAIVAFVIVFLIVVLLVRGIAWGLEKILQSFSLNLPNKVIGGAIHAVVALYVLCVLLWFLEKWNVFPQSQKENSHTYSYIHGLAPRVVKYSGQVVPVFEDTFDKLEELLNKHS